MKKSVLKRIIKECIVEELNNYTIREDANEVNLVDFPESAFQKTISTQNLKDIRMAPINVVKPYTVGILPSKEIHEQEGQENVIVCITDPKQGVGYELVAGQARRGTMDYSKGRPIKVNPATQIGVPKLFYNQMFSNDGRMAEGKK